MFRPRLDHKYFTSDTYWTKWNYLSKWDSSKMNNKDIVVDGILKNPSITTSYSESQWSAFEGTELTLIFDYAKCEINKYIGFDNNKTIKTLNIICINYSTDQYISNMGYVMNSIETINLTVYEKDGKIPEYVKIKNYFLTEARNIQHFNCNTDLMIDVQSYAAFYNCPNVHFNCKIIVKAYLPRVVNFMNYDEPKIPFTQVSGSIRLDNYPYSQDVSSLLKVTREELVRWFTEDLEAITTTQTLTIGSTNLALLTDEDKKIATDKGWTLA